MKHILLLLIITIAGCGNSGNQQSDSINESSLKVAFDEASPDPQNTNVSIERKLIKNGDLLFETSDVKETKKTVEHICKELKAYISNESQNNYEERLQYNQTIRVPADQFDVLIQKLEALAVKVESKNINTQDVTEEFIDVAARLKSKKELESRYREILKQAKTVTDIVSIESQIASVRAEIESMEGRLQYLKNQVAFSTLNLSYYETLGTDFGFANKLVHAIGQGWDNLLSFMITLVKLWPFVILLGGLIWGVKKWKSRKKDVVA